MTPQDKYTLSDSKLHSEDDNTNTSKPSKPELTCLILPELMNTQFPPRENIISPWLPTKGLAMVYAQRGIGKTFFALSIALAVSQGKDIFGWKIDKPHGVLYIDGEMPIEVTQERLRLIGGEVNPDTQSLFKLISRDINHTQSLNLSSGSVQQMIEPHLDNVKLIIIDNISTLCPGKENESQSWIPTQEFALRMRTQGRAVLFVHHAGKSGSQRGTSKREDILDTVISLKHAKDYNPKEGASFELHFEKSRGFYDKAAEPMTCKLVTSNGHSQWEVSALEESTYQKVVRLKKENLSPKDIAEELDINKSTVSRHLKRAKEEGLLVA